MRQSKKTIKHMGINLIFMTVSAIYLIPFVLAIINSLKSAPQAQKLNLLLPTEYYFENYLTVIIEGKLIRAAINGMIYSVSSVAIVLVLCSFTAFILSRRGDWISKFLHSYFMLGIVIPGALIPTFLVLKTLGLLGTYSGLILVYVTGGIPIAIFLYQGFIRSVPKELDEAALVDGAGILQTFFLIIFPVLKPITATVCVITFMTIWNDFAIQLYFGTTKMRAMPLSVYGFFGKYSQSWNLVFADIVLTMLPVLVVYFIGQKYIISGMTAGVVKG